MARHRSWFWGTLAGCVGAVAALSWSIEAGIGYVARSSDRLLDITMLDKEYRLGFVERFIDLKLGQDGEPRSSIITIGDSAFFGFDLPERDTFQAHLSGRLSAQGLRYRVVNLSVRDGRAIDMIRVLRVLERRNVRASYILYDFNLLAYNAAEETEYGVLPSDGALPVGSFYALKMLQQYVSDSARPGTAGAHEALIVHENVLRRWKLCNVDHEKDAYLVELVRLMARLAEHPVVVLYPFPDTYLKRDGCSADQLQRLLDFYRRLIVEAGGEVLDLTARFDDGLFMDHVHLNRKGHEQLSTILLSYVLCQHERAENGCCRLPASKQASGVGEPSRAADRVFAPPPGVRPGWDRRAAARPLQGVDA